MAMFGNEQKKNMFGFDPSKLNMGLLLGGLGMMGGQNPQQQMQMAMQGGLAGYGIDQDRRERSEKSKKEQQQQQALDAYLSAGNFSPGESALMGAYPDLAQSVIGDRMKPQGSDLPASVEEYEYGLEHPEYIEAQIKLREAGRSSTTVNNNDWKIPPGYQLADPDNPDAGVKPTPGGPAEQIPSELAARLGLARDALGKLPEAEQAAGKGDLTGVMDYSKGQIGWGDAGRLHREINAGSEALLRMLTGAGMNMGEARREIQQYLPRVTDDAPTLENKVSQLQRRLRATVEEAMRGRGDANLPPQDEGWEDLGGGVRIRELP